MRRVQTQLPSISVDLAYHARLPRHIRGIEKISIMRSVGVVPRARYLADCGKSSHCPDDEAVERVGGDDKRRVREDRGDDGSRLREREDDGDGEQRE
jgi:hypothetical protein